MERFARSNTDIPLSVQHGVLLPTALARRKFAAPAGLRDDSDFQLATTMLIVQAVAQPAPTSWLVSILVPLLVVLLGGVGAAIITARLTREKTRAETAKTRAETEKIELEAKALKTPASNNLASPDEVVLVDGRQKIDGFVAEGHGGPLWKSQGPGLPYIPASPEAKGTLVFQPNGVMTIERMNTDGRFEVLLTRYVDGGKDRKVIPKNVQLDGPRRLRISCEAKSVSGDHVLRFVARNPVSGKPLAQETRTISGGAWTPIDVYLKPDPLYDLQIRIEEETTSPPPSSVLIRGLVVAERLD